MEPPATSPVPLELPERPEGVERPPVWPWWFAFAAFGLGFSGTLVVGGLIAAILGVDPNDASPAYVVIATCAQAVVFGASAVVFAGFVRKPRPWHFGLRPTSLGRGVKWAAIGIAAFYLVSGTYAYLVSPDAHQKVTEELGADTGAFGLIVAGLMVMLVAPVAEEFFFRGFFFRALRSKFSLVWAAVIDGFVFGIIHYSGDGLDGLLILPPLMVLGFLLCVAYEKSGSLFTAIGMHVFNNALAYAAQADGGWQVSLAVAPVVLAACMLVPRFFEPRPRAAPA
jgi:membrane protease YdiL (CAAX protease family)